MQGLWSRTAQTRLSSQCSSHIHNATALARQSTTKVVQRRVTAGDVFTACYSTILATAAIADSRIKAERRKEWDDAIAKIKEGISTDDSNAPAQTIAQTQVHDTDTVIHGEPNTNGLQYSAPKTPRPTSSQLDPNAPTSQYVPLQTISRDSLDYEADSEAKGGSVRKVFLSDDSKKSDHRKPRTEEHLQQVEDAVRKLVDDLLIQTHLPFADRATITSPSMEFGIQKTELAELLNESKGAFIAPPFYRWHQSAERLEELHAALSTLVTNPSAKSTGIDTLVGKICYNLLLCPTPPNVETYHILISGFSALREHHLAQTVIDSFFNETKLKASEKTAKLLLDYYISTGDSERFRGIIQRMRGVNGDMHIKRKTIYELSKGSYVRKWALENKVIHRGAYLHQKMDRTADIFETLIRGSLLWDGPPGAVRLIRAAIREGKRICSQTIFRVINECVARLDYRSGLKLLDGILSHWDSESAPSVTEYSPESRYTLYRLLAVCGVDPSSDSPRTMLPIPSADALPSMLRWMELKYISDRLARFTDNILSTNLTLGAPRANADADAEKCTQKCLTLLQDSSQAESLRSFEDQKSIAECRSIRERATAIRLEAKRKSNDSAEQESYMLHTPPNQNPDETLERESVYPPIIVKETKIRGHATYFPHHIQGELLQPSQTSPPSPP